MRRSTLLWSVLCIAVVIGLFVIMLVGFGWLIRRDRKQAEAAAASLRARRQRMRDKNAR